MELEERCRRIVDAVRARRIEDELVHPEFVFTSLLAATEGATYSGPAGLRDWAREVDEIWEGFDPVMAEFVPVDAQRAVIVFRVSGRARSSGVPLDSERAMVWTFREGRLCRSDAYPGRSEALAAVGLGA